MIATVPTSNPHMGMLVELAGKISKGVKSYSYESCNDDENDDENEKDEVQLHRKKRGRGISWRVIAVYSLLEVAFDSLKIDGSIPRLKGRNNSGKTSSYCAGQN